MPDRYSDNDPAIDHITEPWTVINCPLCDDHGYRGSSVCDHIDRAPIYRRGMQLVRDALNRTKPHQ